MRWQPPSPEELGRLLQQYEIECLLGHGGMGAVYKGVQKNLDRPVAIKILPPGLEVEDASYIERFKNEAKVMAKFTHPGIVAVHDFGEIRGSERSGGTPAADSPANVAASTGDKSVATPSAPIKVREEPKPPSRSGDTPVAESKPPSTAAAATKSPATASARPASARPGDRSVAAPISRSRRTRCHFKFQIHDFKPNSSRRLSQSSPRTHRARRAVQKTHRRASDRAV